LLSLPKIKFSTYLPLAKSPEILDTILSAVDGEPRILGQKIKHALPLDALEVRSDSLVTPGGRHDNDHQDHRHISVMPTTDELLSKDRPFIRTSEYLEDRDLASTLRIMHLDNQFRLLREDMLGEIRGELQALTTRKTGRHRGIILSDLQVADVEMGTDRKRQPWGIVLQCKAELPHLKTINPEKRKGYLLDNPHILRHGTITCLLLDNEPAAFLSIYRDLEALAAVPTSVVLQFPDDSTHSYALLKMKTVERIQLVQLNTAVFAFEPFLRRLQEMKDIPLAEELLYWEEGRPVAGPMCQPSKVLQNLEARSGDDLKDILGTKNSVLLNKSQMRSLVSSLTQSISLVQVPPGKGHLFKSRLPHNLIYVQALASL
jgi:hypothetical protein